MKRVLVAILAVALFLGLATGFDLLLRLSYLIALILALSFAWAQANVRWLTVSVERNRERAQVGDSLVERIGVSSTGLLPKLWVRAATSSDLPGHAPALVASLPSRAARSLRVTTRLRRRGRYTLGPIIVDSGDPFGLFRSARVFGDARHLIVYPATVPLPGFRVPPADIVGDGRQRRRTFQVTANAAGVRDYSYGDSYNRIHWPSTARMGKLMVKEFELDPSGEVWVLLDLEAGSQAGCDEESTQEYGVTIAASVMKRYLDAGRVAGLIIYGLERQVLSTHAGEAQLMKALEALALARPGPRPLSEALATESFRLNRRSTLVVITPCATDHWVGQLAEVRRRGVAVAVVALEPSTFGGSQNSLLVVSGLLSNDIPAYLVKRGDDLSRALTYSGASELRRVRLE